ncbi:MAG: hypothetical protein GF317_07210 [Candidatus Lokiarchaeota archaeon]|nr:hypothetical protein [Candidatus Lokiarchaeota archaeon]MBD3199496.1 hypothetical protein [Candidatus Lokiarchaeota archaeon]
MKWNSRIIELINIKYPLIMGAFGGWGKAKFASCFSNAGGLGVIAALNFPDFKDFKNDLLLMNELTSKPYGINLSLPHHNLQLNDNRKNQEKTKERYLRYVEIALNLGINVFTTSGYRADFVGRRVHDSGALWVHKCVLIKHALSAEKLGADAITLVGLEGTGFKNPTTQTTLINITNAKKQLKIPIIAAGGIGDANGFLSALLMGADAVCLGTALMETEECPVPDKIKQKWLSSNIFHSSFYNKIYNYNVKNFMAPSTAIGHNDRILSLGDFIKNLIENAENRLKSLGFSKDSVYIS